MLSMWNTLNPIRAKQSQTSIQVSRLNLSYNADDPKNPADRLGLRNPKSHHRAAFMHVRQRPRPLSPGERERGEHNVLLPRICNFSSYQTCQIQWLPNSERANHSA